MSHLSAEKSPYLLQHVDNPVDWYPWCEDAFTRARDDNRMIFLSIGYSTCHWCHVMAHECFEDDEVAALLNSDFVSIKVDREERPDIDQVFMEVCQRLTGSGGWPLTIIMTPDARPFYAATYLPRQGRHGRPGLMELLPWVASKWREDASFIENAGDEVVKELQKGQALQDGPGIDRRLHVEAVRALKKGFDVRYGGFGRAPKFPRPHDLQFLLEQFDDTGNPQSSEIVSRSLSSMRCGGIYDHLGGGFHRYSTDEKWLVPHFEKMLYDQAGLAEAFLAAWLATGTEMFATTTREILDYLIRDMRSPDGAFFSAEDADSEGEEGLFYLWGQDEVSSVLGDKAGEFLAEYNIKEQGNYHDEVSGRLTGRNILHLTAWHEDRWQQFADARKRLLEVRNGRIRPHLDDKVIAAWNGMTISAFAKAAAAFDDSDYLAASHDAALFVRKRLQRPGGRLLRRFRDGEAAIEGFSDDYAFVARGLLDLYSVDFETRWLSCAVELGLTLTARFQDPESGLLYDTPVDGEKLLVRPCSAFDGASPAAGSVAVELFARLFLLTGETRWRDAADRLLRALSGQVARYPAGYTQLLRSSSWVLNEGCEIVIVCDELSSARGLLDVVRDKVQAQSVVLVKSHDNAEELAEISPYTASMEMLAGLPTAYLCQGFSCQRPVNSVEEFKELLEM